MVIFCLCSVLEYATMGEAEQAMDRLSTQTIRGGKVDIVIDDVSTVFLIARLESRVDMCLRHPSQSPRGPPPPRDFDRGYDRGDRGGYGGDRGGGGYGGDRGGGYGGGRDSYRDRRSPPRRDYGGRYDDRERDREYRDRSPRRGGDRDRSPPPRSRDYGRDDRRSPPPPSRERDVPPPRRGDDRE